MSDQINIVRSVKDLRNLASQGQEINFEQIAFEGWPLVEIKIYGDKYHGEITPEVAESLYEFSQSLKRAYAAFKYGVPKVSALKGNDAAIFEGLTFTVGEGCTEIAGKFSDAFQKMGLDIASEAFQHMNSEHILILLIALGVITIGGYVGIRGYAKYKDTELSKRQVDAQVDTVKATGDAIKDALIASREDANKAIAALPAETRQRVYMFGDQVDDGYEKVVRAAGDAERIDIGINHLTKEQIEDIAHKDPVTTQGKSEIKDPVIIHGITKNPDKRIVTVTASSARYPSRPLTLKYIMFDGLDTQAEENLHEALRHSSTKRALIDYQALLNANTGEFERGTLQDVGDLISYHKESSDDEEE
ncbi:hypothetical protein [Vreelandella aquamarina]|uniref:hypothetical protein n=1 Tax=Vreelandella aquamarina TaxID=77097 RepID=UPI00384F9B1F